MKNIKNVFKIINKNHRLWIILLVGIGIVGSYLSSDSVYYMHSQIVNMITDVEEIKQGVDLDDHDKKVAIWDKYEEKYEEGIPQEDFDQYVKEAKSIVAGYEAKMERYTEVINQGYESPERKKLIDENILDGEKWTEDDYNVYDLHLFLENNTVEKDGHYKYNITDRVLIPGLEIYLVIGLVVILFTSGEHLTNFYNFTRMYPWSETVTYIGKTLYALIVAGLTYGLSIFAKYISLKSIVEVGDLLAVGDVANYVIYMILTIAAFVLIQIGIGQMVGNFIGHIGYTIIVLTGLDLIVTDLWYVVSVFVDLTNDSWIFGVDNWINKLPTTIKTMLTPIYGLELWMRTVDYKNLLGLMITGVVIYLIGWYWTKHSRPERSGMISLGPVSSEVVKYIAIVTTANFVHAIFAWGLNSRIFEIGLWTLALAAAYLFYNKLFDVKIKL